ncbi:MAG TPA: FAD-dependent oxidoreductase [Solirubrobacteraceae bacterium]|nr:FAD-dependent oxidoreductase [Solirubrobacteraceae bacterium]
MSSRRENYDVVIVGGGVMGLFTAYHASALGARVVVVECGRVGDPATASFGRTRSYRSDYLDATYARLAHEAFRLWGEFEEQTASEVLVRCGCMNIAKRSVTPDLAGTYAQRSHDVLTELGMRTDALDDDALRRRFPFLDADLARIDLDGGVVDVPAVTRALIAALRERGVAVREGVAPSAIVRDGARFQVLTGAEEVGAGSLVVTAGHGTNQVLSLLPGRTLRVPITKDRPSEAKYLTPPAVVRDLFVAGAMPTIAYLDAGIYCHPIVEGLVDAVKIGYYNPPDLPRNATVIDSIATFVEQCLPGLEGATVRDVEDVDQCDYDLVADDEFVLGPVADVAGAFVGVGWRGTGYKFAPWIGLVLAELALEGATAYDIARFDPARFQKGGVIDASIEQDAAAASS